MPLDLSSLPIRELRRCFVQRRGEVSARTLRSLQKDPRKGAQHLFLLLAKRREKTTREQQRIDSMFSLERGLWKSGLQHVAGVDEVGLGPLAGPVVAAAVIFSHQTSIPGVDDSKRVQPERRKQLDEIIRQGAVGVGVGVIGVLEVDRLNVYQASLLAMKRSLEDLPFNPDYVLTDAKEIPCLSTPQSWFNKGDRISFSIAAASIVAKTHRDRIMEALHLQYPQYGFANHKGYGTAEHRLALREFGACPAHRCSFKFIRELSGG